jgi:hypothetical protein
MVARKREMASMTGSSFLVRHVVLGTDRFLDVNQVGDAEGTQHVSDV